MITNTKVLKFGKTAWKEPVVCHLTRDFDLTFSILKARVLPRQEGIMILEISGEDENYQKGLDYLEQAGVQVTSIEKEILYDETVCTNCGACTGFCPSNALYMADRLTMEVAFNFDKCIGCELCLHACPSRALKLADGMLM